MQGGFQNPPFGQQGNAARAQYKSPNFVTGVSGWIIRKNGSAEFANLTVRGTFNGTNFVLDTAGLRFYSAAPAAGNLITTISAAGGTDSFANPYKAGFWQQNNSTQLGVQIFNGLAEFWNLASPPAVIIPNIGPAGGAGGSGLQLTSGQATGAGVGTATVQDSLLSALGVATLLLNGPLQLPNVSPAASPAGAALYAASGTLAQRAASGRAQPLSSGAAADFTAVTVTVIGFTTLHSWNIPATDVQTGTIWRFTFWGHGTQGSTVQALKFQVNGSLAGNSAVTIPAGFAGASAAFSWRATVVVAITATGSAGNCHVVLDVVVSPSVSTGAGNAAGETTGVAINTTIGNGIALQAAWGSATGAPTITYDGSFPERTGP